MKDQNIKPDERDSVSQSETPVNPEVKRRKKPEPQSSVLKVPLPEDVSQRVSEAVKTLRDRGYECRPEELLKPILLTITQDRIEKLILEHTPDEYYLERARELPELKAIFIKQAKRAILTKGSRRKPRKSKLQLETEHPPMSPTTKGEVLL